MTIFKIISSVLLVVYAILFINIMYSIIQTQKALLTLFGFKSCFLSPFLAVALLNFTQKRYILGGVLTSAVLMLGISIAITTIA